MPVQDWRKTGLKLGAFSIFKNWQKGARYFLSQKERVPKKITFVLGT